MPKKWQEELIFYRTDKGRPKDNLESLVVQAQAQALTSEVKTKKKERSEHLLFTIEKIHYRCKKYTL